MDILTHTLSGIAVGTVVLNFSNRGLVDKLKITLISGFAAALPDIDAISLWSKFDSTIGAFFNLSQSGKEIYSAKLWYSHHAFFHSAFAGVLFSLILALIIYGIEKIFKKSKNGNLIKSIKNNKLLLIGFVVAYLIHLFEDMPTPASTWGGVNFFWPLKSYIGGTGDIWWWNNYDIFLIVVSIIIINLIFSLIKNQFIRLNIKRITIAVFVLGFVFVFIQIKNRDYDFSYSQHTKQYQKYEDKSKEIQKEILGEKLYKIMEKMDNKMKVYF